MAATKGRAKSKEELTPKQVAEGIKEAAKKIRETSAYSSIIVLRF
jgi:hypothetical protein